MSTQKINLTKWQDYRAKQEGSLFYFKTASYSHLPLDDILTYNKGTEKATDYEKLTFGFSHCSHQKLRTDFIKLRKSFIFFTTVYNGTSKEHQGKHLIYGYMQVSNILNIQPRHRRKWITNSSNENESIPDCFHKEDCFALYGNKTYFYSLKDSLELTSELLQKWGYSNRRISRNMKMNFSKENIENILEYFNQKGPINSKYTEELHKILLNRSEIEETVEENDEW